MLAAEVEGMVRDVEALKQTVASHDTRIKALEVTSALHGQDIVNIKDDLSEIKDNTKWILRLIIGGLIGAVIAWIIRGGLSL